MAQLNATNTQPQPLWHPHGEQLDVCRLTAFIHYCNRRFQLSLTGYNSLYRWSLADSASFWEAIWEFCNVRGDRKGPPRVGDSWEDTRWFPQTRLNFAENLLTNRDQLPAIIYLDERGRRRSICHDTLYRQVVNLARRLQTMGIQPGDRICGYLPNIPETIIAMLATSAIGAVWSSCSPDFGAAAVTDRLGQLDPRVLFCVDGYYYNGKCISLRESVTQIGASITSLEQIVVIPFIDYDANQTPDWIGELAHGCTLQQFMEHPSDDSPFEFQRFPFDHPLCVMFSSGTTGQPKGIVHGTGGTLLQHLKEHQLHTDIRAGERVFFYTTCGWMMWNWLVTTLASDATPVLYEGSPFAPDTSQLWDLADEERINVFGTSAKYLSALQKAGLHPVQTHRLESLRAILSTGSPLAPETFEYVYHSIKHDLMLASISGGTDILSCFALGCPLRPVYAGELQCRGLGLAVEVFNEQGQPVYGQKGELVCTQPFPAMPVSFWNDPDGKRYHAAYFEQFPNVWAHGDYAEITAHDGMIIHGRSDAVLNPGGVRIGTAEIYRQVEKLTEIEESLCIGQPYKDDTRIILFVKLKAGLSLTDELREKIRVTIRSHTSPRHVPARILSVPDLPRTRNGKLAELAVLKTIQGEEINNHNALANPKALEAFEQLRETLQS